MSARTVAEVDLGYLERAAALLAAPKRAGLEASAPLGGRVLDVGCGPGIDTVVLAAMVGVDGRVDGVDADPAMIAVAEERALDAAVNDRVTHRVASADALPFADTTFDATRAERLLQHTADTLAVVREMVRVTKPGGTVVLVDTDWTSLSFAGGDPAIERQLTAELCTMVPNPTAGRDLRALLARAGCRAIEIRPFVAAFTERPLAKLVAQLPIVEQRALACGRVAAEELDAWRAAGEELDAAGGFYGHAVIVVATGRVPQ